MSFDAIGSAIAELRKQKGATQEELATHVGLSAQAVSKWECGGAPDAELLPAIADYFGVSIDRLFGRSVTDYADIHEAVKRYMHELDDDEKQIKEAHMFGWDIQRGIAENPSINPAEDFITQARKYLVGNPERDQSRVLRTQLDLNTGITICDLSEALPYFALFPDVGEGWGKALPSAAEYQKLFAKLAEPHVLDCILLLLSRKSPFTVNLLVNKLGVERAEAEKLIGLAVEFGFLLIEVFAVDNEEPEQVYRTMNRPDFIGFLVFAREMMSSVNYFMLNGRQRPYFAT